MVKSPTKIHLQVHKNIIFLAGFAGQGVLNKDPTVWLNGAKFRKNTFASI
jgi:hypothetical protein